MAAKKPTYESILKVRPGQRFALLLRGRVQLRFTVQRVFSDRGEKLVTVLSEYDLKHVMPLHVLLDAWRAQTIRLARRGEG